jgi:hypothetical protein
MRLGRLSTATILRKDFKVGMEHFTRRQCVAVVTDVDWIKHTMQILSFVMPGDMKVFPMAEADRARAWIVEP